MNRKVLPALGAVLSLGLASAGPAAAETGLHWSTYLRSGPGAEFPVLAELEHDELVSMAGCQGKWCKVSEGETVGYVDRDSLDLPQPMKGVVPPSGAKCLQAKLSSYPGPKARAFCEIPTGATPAGR